MVNRSTTGSVSYTHLDVYKRQAKYIIHTVGPIYSDTPEDAMQLSLIHISNQYAS